MFIDLGCDCAIYFCIAAGGASPDTLFLDNLATPLRPFTHCNMSSQGVNYPKQALKLPLNNRQPPNSKN